MEPKIQNANFLKPQNTRWDMIQPMTTMTFFIKPDSVKTMNDGLFASLHSEEYSIEIGIKNHEFFIKRNLDFVSTPYPTKEQSDDVMFEAHWEPEKISVIVLDTDFKNKTKGLEHDEQVIELEKLKRTIVTSPTYPPNSLLTWARHQDIVKKTTYEDKDEFLQEINSAILSIQDQINEAGMQSAFWDIQREGHKFVGKVPKTEPNIHHTLKGLLLKLAIAKNLDIISEYETGSGKLDFLITGILKKGERVSVCVEFKHAHHSKLKDGIKKQLPKYMRTRGTDLGIFVILWCKNNNFDKPANISKKDFEEEMNMFRDREGLSHIRSHLLDLSVNTSPSEL